MELWGPPPGYLRKDPFPVFLPSFPPAFPSGPGLKRPVRERVASSQRASTFSPCTFLRGKDTAPRRDYLPPVRATAHRTCPPTTPTTPTTRLDVEGLRCHSACSAAKCTVDGQPRSRSSLCGFPFLSSFSSCPPPLALSDLPPSLDHISLESGEPHTLPPSVSLFISPAKRRAVG